MPLSEPPTIPAGTSHSHPSQSSIKVRLSVFMFLQYFIWGAWYVSMGTYMANTLKFGGEQIGAAYGAFAIGSMISPFFVGLIADRFFASQKLLAVLGIGGGVAMFALARAQTFGAFYPTLILYCALYAPTLALGNSLSLHHLANAKVDFPRIKIFSAIGWIAGGVALSLLKGEQSHFQFHLAGSVSIAFGLFSLLLPHTPPRKVGQNVKLGEVLGLDALALMKKPSFAIFILCMFLICIPLYFYFVMLGVYLTELQWETFAWKLTLGQVSDVIFLFVLALMLKRLGYKKTIFLGILAWAVRYFFLAQSVSETTSLQAVFIFAAILLHGVCYDFLFIAGQLYVDGEANERNRGAAQGFIAFILWGVGALVGTTLAGKTLAAYTLSSPQGAILHDWRSIWMTPAIGASIVMVVFLIFFREPAKETQRAA
jgi:nucleoside transporter